MRTGIASTWFQNIQDPESKTKMIEMINNHSSDPLLIKLREIVEKKRKILEDSELNPTIYESPSWAALQAHNNGARQMLKYVEDLLAFTKE